VAVACLHDLGFVSPLDFCFVVGLCDFGFTAVFDPLPVGLGLVSFVFFLGGAIL